ncbi:MAG TPA: ABC transporter permease [Bacteroidetes bacterium]|nr:ABC transporter permease [Bacteroidota bacterium]
MLLLKLAWRNIWRNKRRTFITTSSIVMAVLLSIVMGSMQTGQYDQMIQNSAGSFVGHMQIQHELYIDEPTLDHSFEIEPMVLSDLSKFDGVNAVIPRIDAFALAAGDHRSKATMVIGIEADAEKNLSAPNEKIILGEYFLPNDTNSVLVTAGLADFLNVTVGDSLILLGQGFRGVSANGIFPIKGIVKFGIPALNNGIVYLPLKTAQEFSGAYSRFTSVAILIDRPSKSEEFENEIEKDLEPGLVVHRWQTLLPEIIQAIEVDYGSSIVMLSVLYMVVGFGILGTVLMMTAERKYELGVMIAIGTSRLKMSSIIVMEMLFISVLGVICGMLLSLPIVIWFHLNPVYFSGDAAATILEFGMEPFIQFSTDPSIFLLHAIIVLIMALIISIYPVWHIHRLQPVKAMRR